MSNFCSKDIAKYNIVKPIVFNVLRGKIHSLCLLLFVLFSFSTLDTYGQYVIPYSGSSTITVCSGTVTDHAGGDNYSNDAFGELIIQSSIPGNQVQLTGNLQTEGDYDFVYIFDGNGDLLYLGSGYVNIGTITSTVGSLILYFVSDGSVTRPGFNLTINCIAPPTVVPYSGTNNYTLCSGTLTDHGEDSNYGSNANGTAVISPATAGQKVQLTGTINTESSFDYVTIFNGSGTGGTILYGPASGSGNIGTITSTAAGGQLTVRFTSDGSVTAPGFSFDIACVTPVVCTTPGTPVSLSTTAVTQTGFTCNWSAGSPAGSATTSYEIEFYTGGGTFLTSFANVTSPYAVSDGT
jgi:hypothetical protein